jgi:hypothetical protein
LAGANAAGLGHLLLGLQQQMQQLVKQEQKRSLEVVTLRSKVRKRLGLHLALQPGAPHSGHAILQLLAAVPSGLRTVNV